MTTTEKPNIVFFVVDQLVAFALREYGNNVAITPNISKLAEGGTTFERFYCNYPLCGPSRCSMLTGQLPSDVDAFDNASEFSAALPTIPHYLQMAGYHTVLSGKMHFVGPDQLHGFEQRLTTDIYPSDFGWTPDWGKSPFIWYPIAHGGDTVLESGICSRSLQLDYDEEAAFKANQFLYDYARGDDSRPFFLTVSLSHPHPPFYITEEFWNRYKHDDIDMPRIGPMDIDDHDVMSKGVQYCHGLDKRPVPDEFVRKGRHAYYAMVSYIDEKLGELLETLQACELDDNTIVIFTSDHGEMLGERGMWYKRSFFEWSSRVPLIIRDPRVDQVKRSSRLASLVDLMPTILDFAETDKRGDEFRGKSLRGSLKDGAQHDEDFIVCEYLGEGVAGPCRMIVKGKWKYIYTYESPDLLFDLEDDPDELKNIADSNTQKLEEMRSLCMSEWDPHELRKRIVRNQKRRLVLVNDFPMPAWPSWDYEVPSRDKERFVRKGAGSRETKIRLRWPRVPAPSYSLRD